MKVYAQDGEFELTPELVQGLAAQYPAVNVRTELHKMFLWSYKQSPRKRWRNALRGIEAWLKKESARAIAKKESARQQSKRTEVAYLQGVKTTGVSTAWWSSEEGTLAYGRSKGLSPRAGESMSDYRARLRAA